VPEAGHQDRRELTRSRPCRRRVAAVGGAIFLIALVAVVANSSVFGTDEQARRGSSRSGTTTASAVPSSTTPITTAPPPVDVDRRYAVATYTAEFVDSTRSTSPNGTFAGSPTRTLTTTFWHPASTEGGEPDRAHGPYPLVLFVHGYDQTAAFYAPMLERWARAGYVVAGPTFPILSGVPGGASHVDYDKLFGDASFVISQTLASGTDTPIGGLVDGNRIAVVGHSDGEMVSFSLGFAACCREPRVRSVIAMAGDLSNAGVDPMRDSGLPVLHVMETNDEYDPYPHSIDWDRRSLTAPRWMLTLRGASHVPPYNLAGNPYFELVAATTIDFLDGTLKGRVDRLDRISADVAARPDLATIER